MYRNTIFSEILKLLDRDIISKSVEQHQSDKYSKGFKTWNHLTAMIFSQLSGSKSLRDLEIRFNSQSNCHYHLRSHGIKRSTLSDANQNRSSNVFRDIATQLISRQGQQLREMVSLVDSSIIRVDGRGSEWTNTTKTRHGKGLKLHLQCSSEGKVIEALSITGTNVNDITAAKEFKIESDRIYVFDKGYLDYNWWHEIDSIGGYFVTRIKKNTAFRVIEERSIDGCGANIISDKVIELSNKHPGGGRKNLLAGKALRLVEIYDLESKKNYCFISNLQNASADEIALYYKHRWRIELLFKWLKQNLKVTTFLSENENAIKTQIYIAIIVYILIGMFKRLARVFERTIDLLSWVRVAIYSSRTPLKPPTSNKTQQLNGQLSLVGF
jgi:putative transposase